jgi:glycosyltransferase involved in cell wall biosynthesis
MPVLVIDHRSSDETGSIARARGAQVIERDFDGFVNARCFALSQVQTPWTLMIDADEALDAQLRDAVTAAIDDADGYLLCRTTFYNGRPMRLWSGEQLLRLFKTGKAQLVASPAAGGSAQLHERWQCSGVVRPLAGTLLHYSYPTRQSYREKFETYTQLEASGLSASRAARIRELLRTPLRFLWYALVRGGALDGADGLRVAWWSAYYPAAVRAKALRK